MPRRIEPIITNSVYHITTKSVSNCISFPATSDYVRMLETIRFYKFSERPNSFSFCRRQGSVSKVVIDGKKFIDILAYCLMPNHIHLITKQLEDDGITVFMGLVLNSYSKYFNLKYNRKGQLWKDRFNHVMIKSDEQLMHTTRYIHLNPTTAFLVNDPSQWKFSSYREYIGSTEEKERLCELNMPADMSHDSYRVFCQSNIELQRQIAISKSLKD